MVQTNKKTKKEHSNGGGEVTKYKYYVQSNDSKLEKK